MAKPRESIHVESIYGMWSDAQKAIAQEVCECGDYRSQHILGVGWCRLCQWHPAAPGESCTCFRLTAPLGPGR